MVCKSKLTVESRIHPSDVDEQTDHCHALGRVPIAEELVAQNLAGLAAPRHGVDVQVGEVLGRSVRFVRVREDIKFVIEDLLEEVVLDVLAP
jgi:hypothetical protein